MAGAAGKTGGRARPSNRGSTGGGGGGGGGAKDRSGSRDSAPKDPPPQLAAEAEAGITVGQNPEVNKPY
eukprot:SAG22_NODE_50_length_24611_cov_74.139687_3_plen_69_part_00